MAEDIQEEDSSRKFPIHKIIDSIELLEKIKKNIPVIYNHVIIKGDLNTNDPGFPKSEGRFEISSVIKITNSIFLDDINFRGTLFKKSVILGGSIFHGNVIFADSLFYGMINYNSDLEWNIDYELISLIRKNCYSDGSRLSGNANFNGCRFHKIADYSGCEFADRVYFNSCQFDGDACFSESKFHDGSYFEGSFFKGDALFVKCSFHFAYFPNCKFCADTHFNMSTFRLASQFLKSSFDEDIFFNYSQFNDFTTFANCKFNNRFIISGTKFSVDYLTFIQTSFKDPDSQEIACRQAKNVLEKNGNREEAGYHFYREMDARRKQKPWYIRYPEYALIQMIFGYGIHPERLIISWVVLIAIFFILYQYYSGVAHPDEWFEWMKFSFGAAIAPGYIASISNPESISYKLSHTFQIAAMIEAVAGTFLWAGFIATFARKYMR